MATRFTLKEEASAHGIQQNAVASLLRRLGHFKKFLWGLKNIFQILQPSVGFTLTQK
jgi:hypothetical protein